MAHFYRLIFVFLSLFYSSQSIALIAPVPAPGSCTTAPCYKYFATAGDSSLKATAILACSTNWWTMNSFVQTNPNGSGTCYSSGGPYQIEAQQVAPAPLVCPANSTAVTGGCACNATFGESGGACVSIAVIQKTECDAVAQGLTFVDAPLVHHGAVGLTACYGGYVMEGTGAAGGGGQSELYGPFKCSGESASACTSVPKPSSIVTTCAAGSYPGTVNGVQVCVPPSSIVDAPKTTTATPPTAGASAPSIPNAPPGTTSTTEQTTCTGTQCTTTTTFKNESGASLGTKDESKPVTSFCAENPTFQGCKEPEKNKWGAGSCTSPPPCSGDAVMCAIALESFKTSCSLAPPANPESALYDSEKTKTGVLIDTLPGSKTVGISSASFNTTNAIGGGSGGMSDKTVVIAGHSVTIPFSNVNSILGTLGTLLMGIGFLLAGRIVTRG